MLCDRFLDSSLAYQGGAGGLGIEAVRATQRFGIGDFLPDRTLVLAARRGRGQRRAPAPATSTTATASAARPADYHRAVDAGFPR